mmetsp:Transcript_11730/g.12582  ORF Transcript_11730/g.12582 Transcript_11730/m.12582 type:complete len:92 (-) Transcript_11730:223-498(-)
MYFCLFVQYYDDSSFDLWEYRGYYVIGEKELLKSGCIDCIFWVCVVVAVVVVSFSFILTIFIYSISRQNHLPFPFLIFFFVRSLNYIYIDR